MSCHEAVTFMLKKEEGKISFSQQLSLWRHLAICRLCRLFSAQNRLINYAMKQRHEKLIALSEKEKREIIQNVLDQNAFS